MLTLLISVAFTFLLLLLLQQTACDCAADCAVATAAAVVLMTSFTALIAAAAASAYLCRPCSRFDHPRLHFDHITLAFVQLHSSAWQFISRVLVPNTIVHTIHLNNCLAVVGPVISSVRGAVMLPRKCVGVTNIELAVDVRARENNTRTRTVGVWAAAGIHRIALRVTNLHTSHTHAYTARAKK